MKKYLKKIFNASTIGLLFQGTLVQFQGLTYSSNSTNALGPSLSGFFSPGSNATLASFFNNAFTLALSAGAILAVLRLAYAGWLYMGAADMWGSKQKAKDAIFNAILGLLLLIGIYIILFQINPCLLNLNVLQSFQGGSSSASCPTS
jgi:hypothetical protein